VICIEQSPNGEASDCTLRLAGQLSIQTALGWAVLSQQFVPGAQTFAGPRGVRSADAAGAGAAKIKPRGVPDANGNPQFLFVQKFGQS
jgi:hypothetical protein